MIVPAVAAEQARRLRAHGAGQRGGGSGNSTPTVNSPGHRHNLASRSGRGVTTSSVPTRKGTASSCCACIPRGCCVGCDETPATWLVTVAGKAFRLYKRDSYGCVWGLRVDESIGCMLADEILLYVYPGHGFFLWVMYPGHTGEMYAVGDHLLQVWTDSDGVGRQQCTIERTLTISGPGPGVGSACPDAGDANIGPESVFGCSCCPQCVDDTPLAWRVTIGDKEYLVHKDGSGDAVSDAEQDQCVWLRAITDTFCGAPANYVRVRLYPDSNPSTYPRYMRVELLDRLAPDWYVQTAWETARAIAQGPFDCEATQTLSIVSGGVCSSPVTVTAVPVQLRTDCPEASSTDPANECNHCIPGTTPRRWIIDLAGIVANDCDDCSEFNGTFIVESGQLTECNDTGQEFPDQIPPCVFVAEEGTCTYFYGPIVTCPWQDLIDGSGGAITEDNFTFWLQLTVSAHAITVGWNVFPPIKTIGADYQPGVGGWSVETQDVDPLYSDCSREWDLEPLPAAGGGVCDASGATCHITPLHD